MLNLGLFGQSSTKGDREQEVRPVVQLQAEKVPVPAHLVEMPNGSDTFSSTNEQQANNLAENRYNARSGTKEDGTQDPNVPGNADLPDNPAPLAVTEPITDVGTTTSQPPQLSVLTAGTDTPSDNYQLVVAKLPHSLRNLLNVTNIVFGCHPEEGCHYGVWDYRTNTVWLSPNLRTDPDLLYSVLAHELAHVADTYLYSDMLRSELYSHIPSFLNPGEAVADCVALISGGYWTYYWDCPETGLRTKLADYLSL
jgi:hypothetical protein